MIQKRLFYEGWLRNENSIMPKTKPDRFLKPVRFYLGLLFLLMTLATSNAIAALILSTPGHLSEGYPYSEMGLWWKYDEDPAVSAEIEEQVRRVWLRVYEVDNPSDYRGDYVGSCSASFPCYGCGMQYHKWLSPRTFASTAECGTILKPEQWYKWSLKVDFQDGSHWIKSAAFKTGHYQDIIIDDESPNFTQGGPGPFSERGRGYANRSLLVNTTWEENENNYCQWEWTIPEERTYEVSVYIPITSYGGRRLGSSEQARYELWREGLETRSKTIVQNWDYRNLWVSLGTHHFKAGPAKLRLSDNTGESTPLGRKMICDAVRVRKRLGTPGKSYVETPSLRRGTRADKPISSLSPLNREIILSSTNSIRFNWMAIPNATHYRIQISPFKHFDDPSLIKWLISQVDKVKNWWWGATTNNSEESVENGQECGISCINELIDVPHFEKSDSIVVPGVPLYWRVRVENEDKSQNQPLNFGQWSDIYQFTWIEDPSIEGPLPIVSKDYRPSDERIVFDGIYSDKRYFFNKKTGQYKKEDDRLENTLVWAQLRYPENPNQKMPIVLLIHGNYENCQAVCTKKEACGSHYQEKIVFYDWNGEGNYESGDSVIIPYRCEDEEHPSQRIPSHQGYDYIMKKLASYGIFAISINTHDLQGYHDWELKARAELILKYLDKLREWDREGGIFAGKLDLNRIGLVGHSRGGEAIVAAQQMNSEREEALQHSIVALNAIAPSAEEYHFAENVAYYVLQGARDGDMFTLAGLRVYDQSHLLQHPKMLTFVYGANHNYFNTIWTPKTDIEGHSTELGPYDHTWVANDDAIIFNAASPMKAKDQRQMALTTLTAFFRWQLLGEEKYQEIFAGNYKPERAYFTYQAPLEQRLVVDDFEPFEDGEDSLVWLTEENTLWGQNTFVTKPANSTDNYVEFQETLLADRNHSYSHWDVIDNQFFHDTGGMILVWEMSSDKTTAVYRTRIPKAYKDVSQFTHLSLRVANTMPGETPPLGAKTSINFAITLTSKSEEVTQSQTVQIADFYRIPHPYQKERRPEVPKYFIDNFEVKYKATLTGIRFPVTEFDQVDLTQLAEIAITVTGQGDIAIDDLEFTKELLP